MSHDLRQKGQVNSGPCYSDVSFEKLFSLPSPSWEEERRRQIEAVDGVAAICGVRKSTAAATTPSSPHVRPLCAAVQSVACCGYHAVQCEVKSACEYLLNVMLFYEVTHLPVTVKSVLCICILLCSALQHTSPHLFASSSWPFMIHPLLCFANFAICSGSLSISKILLG